MRRHWLLVGACGWVLLILMFVSKFINFSFRIPGGMCLSHLAFPCREIGLKCLPMLHLSFKKSHNILYSLPIRHSDSFPSIHFQTLQGGQTCLFGPCHLLRQNSLLSNGQTREHHSHIYWWVSLSVYIGFTYLLYSKTTWIVKSYIWSVFRCHVNVHVCWLCCDY